MGLLNEEEITVSGCDPKYNLEGAALDTVLSCLMEGTFFGICEGLAFSLRLLKRFVSNSMEGRSWSSCASRILMSFSSIIKPL